MIKSQTATEYLVITAVVIIIALVVISVLGGIPSFGSSADKQTNDAKLAIAPVGVTDYSISDYNTKLFIRNNEDVPITIKDIIVNGEICADIDDFILFSGKTKEVDCGNVFEFGSDSASFSYDVTYVKRDTGGKYSVGNDLALVSPIIATEYDSVLSSNQYWDSSIDGCWNTTVTPHPICTCVDLNKINTNVSALSWNYTLQNHIDFNRCNAKFGADFVSGEGWEPIGNWTGSFVYTGVFDGNNKIVQGLTINRPTNNAQGLFGAVDTGNINNIGIVDVAIVGQTYVGGLAGYITESTISNSYTTGSVGGSSNVVGGLVGGVGFYNTVIDQSYSTANVSGTNNIGGLVGFGGFYANITNSYASGSVTGVNQIGGLIGGTRYSVVFNSYATGFVTSTGSKVGGLIGYVRGQQDISVDASYATGDVTATLADVGGLIGYGRYMTISNSYATGDTSGDYRVGGLVGYKLEAGYLENTYATGRVFCTSHSCGGLVGKNDTAVDWFGNPTFMGTNTFVVHADDDAINCFGLLGSIYAGGNNTNCTAS